MSPSAAEGNYHDVSQCGKPSPCRQNHSLVRGCEQYKRKMLAESKQAGCVYSLLLTVGVGCLAA